MKLYIKLVDRVTLDKLIDTTINLEDSGYKFDNNNLIGCWNKRFIFQDDNYNFSSFCISIRSIARKISKQEAILMYYFCTSSRIVQLSKYLEDSAPDKISLENKYLGGFLLDELKFSHDYCSYTIKDIEVFDRYPLVFSEATIYTSKIDVTYKYTGYELMDFQNIKFSNCGKVLEEVKINYPCFIDTDVPGQYSLTIDFEEIINEHNLQIGSFDIYNPNPQTFLALVFEVSGATPIENEIIYPVNYPNIVYTNNTFTNQSPFYNNVTVFAIPVENFIETFGTVVTFYYIVGKQGKDYEETNVVGTTAVSVGNWPFESGSAVLVEATFDYVYTYYINYFNMNQIVNQYYRPGNGFVKICFKELTLNGMNMGLY